MTYSRDSLLADDYLYYATVFSFLPSLRHVEQLFRSRSDSVWKTEDIRRSQVYVIYHVQYISK